MTLVPIQNAAARGDLPDFRRLLSADPGLIEKQGVALLMHATRANKLAIVRFLSDEGVPFDAPGEKGATPLLYAASMGFEAMVKELVERGADVDRRDEYGWTPLICAASRGHEGVVRILVTHSKSDLDATDKRGWTALWRAACGGHVKSVRALLEGGADPLIEDNEGRTPAQAAWDHKREECARVLEDWARVYSLYRSRRVLDNSSTHTRTHTPAHLELCVCEEEGGRKRERDGVFAEFAEIGELGRAEVVTFTLQRMNYDLFGELMHTMGRSEPYLPLGLPRTHTHTHTHTPLNE